MICFLKKHLPDALCILALLIGVLVFKAWVVGRDNSFVMDDYQHLIYDNKAPILSNLTLLPRQIYNDRPVGDIFYYLAATEMHANYVVAHVWQLLFHMLNTLIAYYILRKLLIGPMPSMIGALMFAVNPMSTMCVQWTSAIYDLGTMTFALASMALLVYHLGDRNRMKYFTPALLLVCYILSVRCKEMTIFLPFIWVLLMAVYYLRHNKPLKEMRSELGIVIPSLLFFCVIFVQFLALKAGNTGPMTADPKNPYYQSFAPLSMAGKLVQYLLLYLGDNRRILIAVALFCMAFCRKKELPIHLAMIGLTLVLILPMVNTRHQLYLYVPSFFIALLVASSLDSAFRLIRPWPIQIAIAMLLVALFGYDFWKLESGNYFNRAMWLHITGVERGQALQFKDNVKFLAGNERILVYNLPDNAHNIFTFYGPGNSIRMYTGVKGISFKIDPRPAVSAEEKAKYHMAINFNGGKMIFEKVPRGVPNLRYKALY